MSRQRQAEMRGEGIRGRGRIGLSIVFWNVARLQNKDREFWRGLDRGDIVVLSETLVEEKNWEKVRDRLPKRF